MTQGYSHYDRQLRNDLLVLISLAASHCPQAPFIESGFAKQLMLFATFQEVRSHNMLVRHLKLSTNHEDFELKKLLMNVIVVLSKEPAMIPIVIEAHFLLALLTYVRNNENASQPQEWSPSQFEELQLHAMSSLCTIAPQCVQDYMSYQGNTRLLLLLEWCVGKDDYGGHGNSYHALGGRGNKRAQMRYCLHLMRSMVSAADEACNQDLVDQGTINQLLEILSSASRSSFPDDEVDVEMQCDMLFILSTLCDGDLHRKELFGSKGVEAVLQYLKVNPEKICLGLGHHRLMVACVDCIWSCVIAASINEDLFLTGEGVFLLMNLLECCPADMYNLVLGCLLDLCENPKSVGHMMAWRGQENRTACNLLVDIWRKEEAAIGVKRDANGFITDPANPLMGTLQAREGVESQPADCTSRAILDVFENLRAKIYSLFCKIGFADLPGLSVNDLVTLSIIEKYLELKSGEVWAEVLTELEQEGVRPVTPDQEAMEVMARAATERVNAVLESQGELLESQQEQDLLDEQDMYAEIRDNHKQKEKAIADWKDFVARTSDYSVLKIAKDMQKTSIDVSRTRLGINESDVFHATDLPHLQTTTFQGRSIAIRSTPLNISEEALSFIQDKEVKLKERSAVFV
ncbi:cilia- and flagella-associated protein 69-like [Anneissia japonica]|uniref:cilia- and flagella-associated protein 69-like n=1 Tax=Anneissia japonica TaxID=1529436 RepID=UPI001425B4D7|nr:cilia- and flagella-associated protein 69-like [Anneissia japonica]